MKKFIVLIMMMSGYVTHSQSTDPDKLWISRRDALGTLARIERLKADSAERKLLQDEIKDLNQVNVTQRTSIFNLQGHVKTQDLQIENWKQRADETAKELKKVKAKAVAFKVAGIGLTASLTFLLIAFK